MSHRDLAATRGTQAGTSRLHLARHQNARRLFCESRVCLALAFGFGNGVDHQHSAHDVLDCCRAGVVVHHADSWDWNLHANLKKSNQGIGDARRRFGRIQKTGPARHYRWNCVGSPCDGHPFSDGVQAKFLRGVTMNLNYEALFTLSNIVVMPFWLLMIFLPHWKFTKRVIASPLVALPTALLYAACFAASVFVGRFAPESDARGHHRIACNTASDAHCLGAFSHVRFIDGALGVSRKPRRKI